MSSQEQNPSPEDTVPSPSEPVSEQEESERWVDGYWDILWDWEDLPEETLEEAPRPRVQWYRDVLLVPVIFLVFFLDQFTKAAVREGIALGQSVPAEGFLRLTHVVNTGGAFGLLPNQTLLLIGASVVGIGILVFIYRRQPQAGLLLRLALGLQLGGALGNLADRLFRGYVVDFIDVGPWPIFNLADASIVVGIFLLLWLLLGNDHARHTEEPSSPYEQ